MDSNTELEVKLDNALYALVVDDYMMSRKSFTSLDIANQLKDDGYRIRNYQVAEWLVNNAIRYAKRSGYLYNQTLINVDSKNDGMTMAYLYHHYQVDADTYLDRDQNPKSFQSVPSCMDPVNLPQTGIPEEIFFSTRSNAQDYARNNPKYIYRDLMNWDHTEWYRLINADPNGNNRWVCMIRR